MRAVAAAFALALLVAQAADAADALWTVAIVGRRDVVMPMRQGDDGMPSADAHMLGPELSVSVSARNDTVAIRDSNGVEWQTVNGSLRLDGPLETRQLSAPVVVMQEAVFLPLDSIAQLAGRKLVLENKGRAFLLPLPAPAPSRLPVARPAVSASSASGAAAGDVRAPRGWETFSLPKTREERQASARDDEDLLALRQQPSVAEVLPSAHEALGLDLGAGYAQGGGAALDLLGGGTLAGYRATVATFLTGNSGGMRVRSGKVTLESPSASWTAEAGDLLTEMRGLASGVRFSRRVTARWRPGVSVYVNDSRVPGDRAALAYRDDLLLTRNIDLRGEASTDGSRFVGVRLIAGRGNIETFYRYARDRATTDRGVSLSYNVWGGVSAYGATRFSDGDAPERWQMVGLAVPLFRQSSVSLEQAYSSRATSSDTARTLGLQLPFGPLRLMQRYTWTDVALLGGPSVFASGRRQLQSMASWSPSTRLRFTYQMGTQWLAGSDARQWTELESVLRLSSRTSVHAVTGFPSVTDRERLRVGMQQRLPREFRLSIDYGRLPAFQSRTLTTPEVSRLLVMVRRTWAVPTPAAGTTVTGTVRDDGGTGVPGAVVALGRYLTTTRDDGHYEFAHVPPGTHTLSLVREHLPAAYSVSDEEQVLTVAGGSRALRADLAVTALHSIHGRAFLDRNGNGRMDDDEGLSGIVIRLDDGERATLTDEQGTFAFYNLEPGRYTVWLDRERLRSEWQLTSPERRTVDLQPEAPLTHVDFALAAHDRPVFFKEQP